jgi:hypothetical protein
MDMSRILSMPELQSWCSWHRKSHSQQKIRWLPMRMAATIDVMTLILREISTTPPPGFIKSESEQNFDAGLHYGRKISGINLSLS